MRILHFGAKEAGGGSRLLPAADTRPAGLSDGARNPGTRPALLFCAVLLALCSTAFYPSLHNGLINLDDPGYVSLNPHVQHGLTGASVEWAFTTVQEANWHPVTWLSHMLDYQLFGERVWGHHLSSLVLHCLNTLALFLVLRRLTGALWRSFFVAAFFAVHPLRVESVAWVAERKDVLSALFFLLTVWAYAWYAMSKVQSPKPKADNQSARRQTPVGQTASPIHGPPSPGEAAPASSLQPPASFWYWLSLVLFALGLMSKPMLVTLPFVLLLLDFWPLQRLMLNGRLTGLATPFRLVLEKVPFILLAMASSVITMVAQRAGGLVVSSGGVALLGRAENALVSYCRYLAKLFWPANLAVFYPLPNHWPGATVIAAVAVLLVVSGLVIWFWRRAPYLTVGWGWFIGTLVPVIGLVQVGWQAMADRYTYIPSIGIYLMLVWGASALARTVALASVRGQGTDTSSEVTAVNATRRDWRLAAGRGVLPAAGILLVLICVVLTRHQLVYWKDSESLFRHTLAVTADNAFAHETLGLALRLQGRVDESIAEMREAIRIYPEYARAHRDLGSDLITKGDLPEAIRSLQTALRLAPRLPRTHKQLGLAFQKQGHLDEASVQYQDELRINPDDAEAHTSLGAILLGGGRLPEAISEFEAALRLDPDNAEAHSNLGIALCRKGNWAEGINQFEKALLLKPDYAEGHNNLGVALARSGRRDDAIRQFTEALRLQPDYLGAAQQLRALTNAP